MSATEASEIREGLSKFIKARQHQAPLVCTVDSVNTTDLTCYCIPINGDADVQAARLMSQASNGLLVVPTVGSVVIVNFIDFENAYVAMFSTVQYIYLNGDNYDGIPQVAKLVEKYNNLENKVNDLITFTATHTHTGVTTGAGTSGTSATPVTGALTPTTQNELENTTVKHGNGT